MGAKEAVNYDLVEEKNWYLRVDDAKANLTAPASKADWFKRVSVELPNGDFVGVLEYVNIQERIDQVPFRNLLIEEVMELLSHGMIPTKQVADLLDAKGTIIKDDGQPMGSKGIQRAIERIFSTETHFKGKEAKVTVGEKRYNHSFPKGNKSWIDCEYNEELLDAIAVAEAKKVAGS